jgi:hypothetical protein
MLSVANVTCGCFKGGHLERDAETETGKTVREVIRFPFCLRGRFRLRDSTADQATPSSVLKTQGITSKTIPYPEAPPVGTVP